MLPNYKKILNLKKKPSNFKSNLANSLCEWLVVWLHHKIEKKKPPWLMYVCKNKCKVGVLKTNYESKMIDWVNDFWPSNSSTFHLL